MKISPGTLGAGTDSCPPAVAARDEAEQIGLVTPLSGVASATRGIADAIEGPRAQVCRTRKTMPGLRFGQKCALRAGGGSNHPFELDDAVLIKDNHVAIADGVARRWSGRGQRLDL